MSHESGSAGTTTHDAHDGSVLTFDDVDVRFKTEFGTVHAVKGVTLDVKPGEVVALVGESGSGKSVTSMTSMRLLPSNARIDGRVAVTGTAVGDISERKMRKMRGNNIAMIFQEPMTALNPVLTIGTQLTESLELHGIAVGKDADKRAVELLEMVGIPEPERRVKQYPHELSGGQRQRVVIAIAISCDPKVIIADEPTTALDVTVQADILDLLRSDRPDHGLRRGGGGPCRTERGATLREGLAQIEDPMTIERWWLEPMSRINPGSRSRMTAWTKR